MTKPKGLIVTAARHTVPRPTGGGPFNNILINAATTALKTENFRVMMYGNGMQMYMGRTNILR